MKNNFIKLGLLSCLFMLGSCDTTVSSSSSTEASSSSTQSSVISSESSAIASSSSEVSSSTASNSSETAQGFTVTFNCDSNCSVKVYTTQACDVEDTNATYLTRNGDTGEYSNDPTIAQINFIVTPATVYVVDTVSVTTGDFNKIKTPSDTEITNGYRITKIESDLTVSVTSRADSAQASGFAVTFSLDEHVSVTVYKTKTLETVDTDTNIQTRDGDTGEYCKDGTNSQLNFKVNVASGYKIKEVTATAGNYKNIKNDPDSTGDTTVYRITKITGDITVTITTESN